MVIIRTIRNKNESNATHKDGKNMKPCMDSNTKACRALVSNHEVSGLTYISSIIKVEEKLIR